MLKLKTGANVTPNFVQEMCSLHAVSTKAYYQYGVMAGLVGTLRGVVRGGLRGLYYQIIHFHE